MGPTQPTAHPEPLRHPGHHQMMPEGLSSRLTHMPLKSHRGLPTWRQVLHVFQAGTERDSLSRGEGGSKSACHSHQGLSLIVEVV